MKIDSDEVTSSDQRNLEFTSEEIVHPRLEFIVWALWCVYVKRIWYWNAYATGLVVFASV